jgi:murein DD-endopeptidase MepM/ murein hydrolase activator NlpD
VLATAMIGAGVVALGAGAAFDAEAVADPQPQADDAAARDAFADRASRADDRAEVADTWLLPVHNYDLTSPSRWAGKQPGVSLAVPEGTPYVAAHSGTVTLAEWQSGYGYTVIVDHGNGVETLYGHSSKLLVRAGQQVQAGEQLGLVGLTGYTTGPALRLEVHANGAAVDATSFFAVRGVDFKLELEAMLPTS